MSDLKLAVGKKYWTRNGRIRTVVERDTGDTEYPWRHSGNAGDSDWCMDDGRDNSVAPHDTDLVRELTAEELLTEQTIETFAAITRDGGKVPDRMKRQCRSKVIDEPFVDVMELDIFHTCLHYRLVPIEPPKPEMVPLEASDVPPGSYFKRAGDSWLAPSDVCRTGVHFYGLDMPFEKLMEEGWQILRPGQTEWAKCEKVKPWATTHAN